MFGARPGGVAWQSDSEAVVTAYLIVDQAGILIQALICFPFLGATNTIGRVIDTYQRFVPLKKPLFIL